MCSSGWSQIIKQIGHGVMLVMLSLSLTQCKADDPLLGPEFRHRRTLNYMSVTVTPAVDTVVTGLSAPFTAVVKDSGGNVVTGVSINWSSSDTTVAKMSSDTANALAAGTVVITATADGGSGTAELTVVQSGQIVPVTTVMLSPTAATVDVGQTTAFTATLLDALGNVLTGRTVTWSSSNTSVATVSNGTATGVTAGTATITATAEGQSSIATVSVQPATTGGSTGGTVDWFSDWRNGTGNSLTSTQDGSKFNDYCCTSTPPSLFTIVPASGLGFPAAMSNVAQIDGDGSNARKMMAAADESPVGSVAPNVGEYQYLRWYYRNSAGTGIEAGGAHVIESHVGYIAWAFKPMDMQSDGTYQVNLFLNRTNSYTDFWTSNMSFIKNTTYRWEIRLYRVDPTNFQFAVRVYGPDDTAMLATEGNFTNVDGVTNLGSANPTMPINNILQDLQSIDVGQPDQAGSIWTSGNYMYVGGMAMRKSASSSAWIGNYNGQ